MKKLLLLLALAGVYFNLTADDKTYLWMNSAMFQERCNVPYNLTGISNSIKPITFDSTIKSGTCLQYVFSSPKTVPFLGSNTYAEIKKQYINKLFDYFKRVCSGSRVTEHEGILGSYWYSYYNPMECLQYPSTAVNGGYVDGNYTVYINSCPKSKDPVACMNCVATNPQAAPYCASCYNLPTTKEQNDCFKCLNSYSGGEQQSKCPNTLAVNLLNSFNSDNYNYGFSNLNPSNASSCVKSSNPHGCMNCLRYYQGKLECATLDSKTLALFTDDNVNKYGDAFNNNVGFQPIINCSQSKDIQSCLACINKNRGAASNCASCCNLSSKQEQSACFNCLNFYSGEQQAQCSKLDANVLDLFSTSNIEKYKNAFNNNIDLKTIIDCANSKNTKACINCISKNTSSFKFCPACINSANFDTCLNGCVNQVSGDEKQGQCATLVNKYTDEKGFLDQAGFYNAVKALQNS